MENVWRQYRKIWIIQWFLMMALWFAFVGKVELAEALVGIVAATLAATGDLVIRTGRFARFKPRARWLVECWRIPGSVVRDLGIVFQVLSQHLAFRRKSGGVIRCIPFTSGGPDAGSAARRAVAILFTTIPPNTIVIGIDRQAGSMLVHQLRPSDIDEVTRRLGAK